MFIIKLLGFIFIAIVAFIAYIFIADFVDNVKRNMRKTHVSIRYAKRNKERTLEAKKLFDFTSYDQLPDDTKILYIVMRHCQEVQDTHREFLCVKKSAEVSAWSCIDLASYYMNGIGTEQNTELASKEQAKYFLFKMQRFKDRPKAYYNEYYSWITDAKYFFDPIGLQTVAEELIKKGIFQGIPLLEDAILAQELGLTLGATVEDRTAAYSTIPQNPYAMYHLWLYGDRNDKTLLTRSGEMGCWMAAVELENSDMLSIIEKYASDRLAGDWEWIREECTHALDQIKHAKKLFKMGLAEYESGEASLDNKAWTKIDEAIYLGNHEAELWACRTRAELGDPAAEFQMAQYLLEGIEGFEKDIDRAILLLMRSAGKNVPQAQHLWGRILERGEYNVPADKEQAIFNYTRAALQNHKHAALDLGRLYVQSEPLDVNKAMTYLIPLSNDEDKSLRRDACYWLMMLYRENKEHIVPFPGLEKALHYAFRVACIDFENTDDKRVKRAIADYDTTIKNERYCNALSVEYRSIVSKKHDVSLIPLSETIVLWQIQLLEAAAEQGDTNAMINLDEQYDYVGSYILVPNRAIKGRMEIEFSGNRQRGSYWLKKAVSLGSTDAMWIMGEEWKHSGISSEEGRYWLEKAAALGNEQAQETLKFEASMATHNANLEKQLRQYLNAHPQERLVSDANGQATRENLDAPLSVHSIPSVITGPYGRTYRRTAIHSFSAEYTNDYGETIVIEDRNLGARSATTSDGYFHW